MKLKPIGKRVLCRPIKPDKVIGSIHVPEGFDTDAPTCGVVLAIGEKARCNCDKPDCDAGLPDVRVGDAVVFHRFDSGDLLRWRGEEFLLVDASKIKAKLE